MGEQKKLGTYSLSDCGKKRANNQDSFSNYFHPRFSLLLLADGMGGHQDGALASSLAVEACQAYILENQERRDYLQMLVEAVNRANTVVFEAGKHQDRLRRMGTTLCAALVHEDTIDYCHVGDSRIYLWQKGKLRRLTDDHSVVFDLVQEGAITEEEALHHPDRHTLTRALGTEVAVASDPASVQAQAGDILLLCSDGLTNMVEDAEISQILASGASMQAISQELIDRANAHGGTDNITVTVYEMGGADASKGAQ